jgi:CBS-domain-containing membrane protein
MAGVDGASFYGDPDPFRDDVPANLRLADIRTAEVAEVMSPLIHCIRPTESLAVAAARMTARRVHRLVVVDAAARVVGILSATDLLRAVPGVVAALDEEQREVPLGRGRKSPAPRERRVTT